MALPSDISGLVAWYKGESGRYDATSNGSLVADGGTIARWEDQSGNGNHCTQATSGARPKRFGNYVLGEFGAAKFFNLPSVTIDQQAFSLVVIMEIANGRKGFVAPSTAHTSHVIFENVNTNFGLNGNTGKAESFGGSSRLSGLFIPTSRTLVGWASGGANSTIFVNAASTTGLAAAPSGSTSGGRILGYSDSTSPLQAVVVDVMLYSKQLSAGEITTLQSYAVDRGVVFPSAADRSVVVSGDSISAGAANTKNQNWVRQTTMQGTPLVFNESEAGITLSALNTAKASWDTPLFQSGIPNRLFITAGSNDILAGTSAASLKTILSTYGTAEKSAGFKVIATTLLPRTDVTGTPETERTSYNTSVRGDFGVATAPSYADGIMDWGSDPTLNDASATDLFPDGVHPSDTAAAVLAKYAAPFVASSGFSISGPVAGAYTVTIASGGEFRGQMKIRLTASAGAITATAAGGTIANNGTGTVDVTPVAGATSFTFTASAAATISYTNAQGWTNPSSTEYAPSSGSNACMIGLGFGLGVG